MYVGVDGCRSGWIAVTSNTHGLVYKVFARISDLFEEYRSAELVLVDIPIGLPWSSCPMRPCDQLARKILGIRASSVFPAPSRNAAGASNVALARIRNIEDLGRSLSAQAWGICSKIAEVDNLLLSSSRARSVVREIHPEVCFWALNGRMPMTHSKKTPAGTLERTELLSDLDPSTALLLERVSAEQLRKHVQRDDVLDAHVAYLTAKLSLGSPQQLHGQPKHDERGLPMQMLHF